MLSDYSKGLNFDRHRILRDKREGSRQKSQRLELGEDTWPSSTVHQSQGTSLIRISLSLFLSPLEPAVLSLSSAQGLLGCEWGARGKKYFSEQRSSGSTMQASDSWSRS